MLIVTNKLKRYLGRRRRLGIVKHRKRGGCSRRREADLVVIGSLRRGQGSSISLVIGIVPENKNEIEAVIELLKKMNWWQIKGMENGTTIHSSQQQKINIWITTKTSHTKSCTRISKRLIYLMRRDTNRRCMDWRIMMGMGIITTLATTATTSTRARPKIKSVRPGRLVNSLQYLEPFWP